MDEKYHTHSEIDRLLRGDLSDIDELEDIDLEDEVEQIFTEEYLQEQLLEFEDMLGDEGIAADGEDIPEAGGHIGEQNFLPTDIDEALIEGPYIEDIPLFFRLSRTEQVSWRKKWDIKRWRDISPSYQFPDTNANIEFDPPPGNKILLPKEYFNMFIDNEIINNIAFQTNLYSVQNKGVSILTNPAEIEQFLGVHLLESIVKMPALRMYWAQGTRYEPIAQCMSRNRFELLRRTIHLNDNANLPNPQDVLHDKLFKLRLFIDRVRSNMGKIELEEKLSIDELIIPFKGRTALKQYNPKKPHKWGIKVFALASTSGIIHDFEIYVGKGTVRENKLGISGDIVLRLIELIPRNKNYKLFVDNWFNSHTLLCKLKSEGIHATGTVRSDRIGHCPFTSDKDLRQQGRGSFQAKIDVENDIVACKWYDNKAVCLASTSFGPEPVEEVQRWSVNMKQRVPVPRPAIVGVYNSSMGGVDLHDMLVELYRTDFKIKRYYFRIFFHIIDMCVVNAWLVYRRHLKLLDDKSKPIPLLQFKSSVAYGLLESGQNKTTKKGRPSTSKTQSTAPPGKKYKTSGRPTDDVRYDNIDHWPSPEGVKKRCKVCIKNYSTIKCSKCQVELCLNQKRNCFLAFHKR